jgi:hypothetical protein
VHVFGQYIRDIIKLLGGDNPSPRWAVSAALVAAVQAQLSGYLPASTKTTKPAES